MIRNRVREFIGKRTNTRVVYGNLRRTGDVSTGLGREAKLCFAGESWIVSLLWKSQNTGFFLPAMWRKCPRHPAVTTNE